MAKWTQSDIDNLKAAVASGVLTVRYDGPPARTLTYQDLSQMRSLLAEMVQEVSRAAGGTTVRYARTGKGL